MRQLFTACLLFLMMALATNGQKADRCQKAEKFLSYLDIASDMIIKVKESFRSFSIPGTNSSPRAVDCEELLCSGFNESGVYRVWPRSRVLEDSPIRVFCDMDTDVGGWTVIQRRGNFLRAVDYFFKDWINYKKGFGGIEKDFWLGNDNIFALTNQRLYSLRIDLQDVEGNERYALYDHFWIEDESQKYRLHIKDYSGDAGDSMYPKHDNQKFSTKDQKNDNRKEANCAQLFKGAWWYNECHDSNLNGLYLRGKHESLGDGVNWRTWKGSKESMYTVEMKIRPKIFNKCLEISQTPVKR